MAGQTGTIRPSDRLVKLGFKNKAERQDWIQEHRQEILAYGDKHGIRAAVEHFHIARETINRLTRQSQDGNRLNIKANPMASPKSAMTPDILANALIDKLVTWKSDNCTLKQENIDLRNRVQYLEGQLRMRDEEVAKQFQEKLQKLLAEPGD